MCHMQDWLLSLASCFKTSKGKHRTLHDIDILWHILILSNRTIYISKIVCNVQE